MNSRGLDRGWGTRVIADDSTWLPPTIVIVTRPEVTLTILRVVMARFENCLLNVSTFEDRSSHPMRPICTQFVSAYTSFVTKADVARNVFEHFPSNHYTSVAVAAARNYYWI